MAAPVMYFLIVSPSAHGRKPCRVEFIQQFTDAQRIKIPCFPLNPGHGLA